MKRLLIAAMFSLLSLALVAQPKAIGLRLGNVSELSYQHYVGNSFFEVDLGADSMGTAGVRGDFSWNWIFARPSWTTGSWAWYAGALATAGYVNDLKKASFAGRQYKSHDMGFMTGIGLQLGCEYTFWFPLQLSLSLRPVMGMHVVDGLYYTRDPKDPLYGTDANYDNGRHIDWYRFGLAGLIPTLGVHYSF